MRRHRTKMQLPQLITQLRRRRRQQQQQLGHLLLLLLLLSLPPPSLSAEGQQHPPLDSSEVVAATSGQEYLGQFTFFRSWVTKRRILIVSAVVMLRRSGLSDPIFKTTKTTKRSFFVVSRSIRIVSTR